MPNSGESYPEGLYFPEDLRTPEEKTRQRIGKLVSNVGGERTHRRWDDTIAVCGVILKVMGYDAKLPLCKICEALFNQHSLTVQWQELSN